MLWLHWQTSSIIDLIMAVFVAQNLISVIILLVLELFGVISTEKLTWKLIKVWIPVNLIFVGMLVTGMYRYVILRHDI